MEKKWQNSYMISRKVFGKFWVLTGQHPPYAVEGGKLTLTQDCTGGFPKLHAICIHLWNISSPWIHWWEYFFSWRSFDFSIVQGKSHWTNNYYLWNVTPTGSVARYAHLWYRSKNNDIRWNAPLNWKTSFPNYNESIISDAQFSQSRVAA